MIWYLAFLVLACLFCVIYVREERLYTRQWVQGELWHAHVAHMKECHAEEWNEGHPR